MPSHAFPKPADTFDYGEDSDRRIAEAERAAAKKAWDEGYETGCESRYGYATACGNSIDPDVNPYRREEAK